MRTLLFAAALLLAEASYDERIVIHLADRMLFIVENGKVEAMYPIAIGKPETPTPIGEFHVRLLDPHPGSSSGMFGRRWIEFFRQRDRNGVLMLYGIHGTNEPDKIGDAVSHGCIRMSNHDIEQVFKRAYVGEPVTVEPSP